MQLMLIFGIAFAIATVAFALQNNVAVTVTVAIWQFEGSLALVMLLTLGLGVLIAGLLSSPTVIRGQWTVSRLRHQVADLEKTVNDLQRSNESLLAEPARMDHRSWTAAPESVADKAYVGLKAMLAGKDDVKP